MEHAHSPPHPHHARPAPLAERALALWRDVRPWLPHAAALVWLAFFSAKACQLGQGIAAIRAAADRPEGAFLILDRGTEEIAALVRQTQAYSRELEFMTALLDYLPKDKGYLRTQRAVSEEVHELRKKAGRRLAGRLHVLVDTKTNKLYVKRGLSLLWAAECSVGRGGVLADRRTGRRWEFVTPHGEFRVLGKTENPVWLKPDWAFVESKEAIPPPDDPARKVEGELGRYLLNIGDGYLLHGTRDEAGLGRPASHGCVRLGAADLERLYKTVPIGTKVYIY